MIEERMRVLEMLCDSIITVEEAEQLLNTIDNPVVKKNEEVERSIPKERQKNNSNNRFLIIKVMSNEGDKVNVNLPVSFLKAAVSTGTINAIYNKTIKIDGIKDDMIKNALDLDLLIECIQNDYVGSLVDISSADGTEVQIYFE